MNKGDLHGKLEPIDTRKKDYEDAMRSVSDEEEVSKMMINQPRYFKKVTSSMYPISYKRMICTIILIVMCAMGLCLSHAFAQQSTLSKISTKKQRISKKTRKSQNKSSARHYPCLNAAENQATFVQNDSSAKQFSHVSKQQENLGSSP